MNIHAIHQSIRVLTDLVRPQPAIRDIHSAMGLLDPFGLFDEDPFTYDCLYTGVHAMRDCYPETYAEVITAWHNGADEEALVTYSPG